jgi:hypothetical protein
MVEVAVNLYSYERNVNQRPHRSKLSTIAVIRLRFQIWG